MALQLVVKPVSALEKRTLRRRGQLRAIRKWLDDIKDGQDELSLTHYCDDEGVSPWGIKKMMREPKIRALIDQVTEDTSRVLGKVTTSLLLKRVEKEGKSMDTKDIVRVNELAQKIKAKAFQKSQESHGSQVLVNINLPEGGYDKPIRVEAVERAKEKLDGLV